MKILDYYVHQGNQAELFKLDHEFFLTGVDSLKPKWNHNHRPLPDNVILLEERRALKMKFDVVMVRSPLNMNRYRPFMDNGATPVANVQTTSPFQIPKRVRHMVWNSVDVMDRFKDRYPKVKHHYIVHGYDPGQFQKLDYEKNGKVLTVANVFRRRGGIMGYPLWETIDKELGGICDVLGHGNDDCPKSIGEAENFEQLLRFYNEYSIFFNPTKESAMPRSRAEAAMCGMPIVSTKNYDIARYFTHKKNAIITNDRHEMQAGIKMLLESEAMREDFGEAAREISINHFHINDYHQKWEHIFKRI